MARKSTTRFARLLSLAGLVALAPLTACSSMRPRLGAVEDGLQLETVVLYRNGIGYFERRGQVDGDILKLRVRKDQVNDLLKSLTVVDENGRAVSVSMPLDPRSWANLALAKLAPGRGSLAEVLDSLRGTEVVVYTAADRVRGRIVMVEQIVNEPDPDTSFGGRSRMPGVANIRDYKLTLLISDRLEVVRLSKVRSVVLRDGDLAMQLHRSLDASAGEGMFEQVDIEVRLSGARNHQLLVSYVANAPMWKPTYRVVLPPEGRGQALLQGWAVVDNVSGEDWNSVALSLTSGAPIAFRYDLHTPRDVPRADLTESGVRKRAAVALGETSFGDDFSDKELSEEEEGDSRNRDGLATRGRFGGGGPGGGMGESAAAMDEDMDDASERKSANKPRASKKKGDRAFRSEVNAAAPAADPAPEPEEPMGPALDLESLRRSTMASARSKRIAGLTRIDVQDPVTVPDGTSTMVALLNEQVRAEEAFLFRPGGAGIGYEVNPYRVVRFENTTDYVLEPGPISIYSGGSFVGEGLSEAVAAKSSVTIPFAVEPTIMVTSARQSESAEMKLIKIVRGVLEVENFYRTATRYEIKGKPTEDKGYRVLIRHPRAGGNYELAVRPPGTEDLVGAYLVPVDIPKGKASGEIKIVEETPSRTTIKIWNQQALKLLEDLLKLPGLTAEGRKRLQPIVDLRQKIGRIDSQVSGLKRQQSELDERMEQTRKNLEAIKKDPAAGKLRAELNKRIAEFSKKSNEIGREIVTLGSDRMGIKIELEDKLVDFDLRPPKQAKGGASPDKAGDLKDPAAKP